ncbi:MAG TPA: MFS transporter [Thiobacillaceae bacterium]|nr:MFS transporter [Thiobacillaceae bacterium]
MLTPAEYRRFNRVRWTIFAVLVVSYMMVYFHRMAPGVVAADLMRDFAISGAALGSLAAMYYYVYTAMQIPAGVLADTFGPRISAGIGSLVAGAGSILFGLAPDFATASAGRLLVGLGVSVVFVGLMRSNTVWFSERRYGMVSGLTLLLGNLGSILAAGPLAAALGFFSWRSVFVGAGVASLGLAGLTFWRVRSRPEDAGFPPVNTTDQGPARRHWWQEMKSVLANRAAWPGFWVNFGVTGSLFAFAGLWGVPLMRDVHGLDRGTASLYTTAALAGFALGSFLMGSLSDRIGRRKPVILGAGVLSCASWLALMFLPWGPGLSGYALYALLGLTAGGFVVTYAAAKEVVPPANAGMAIALVNTGLFLGAAIMQPLFGWVADLSWDGTLVDGARVYPWTGYRNGLAVSAGFAALAVIGALFLRETHCRNRSLPGDG